MGIFNFGPSKKELRKQILELQNQKGIIEKNLEEIKSEKDTLKDTISKLESEKNNLKNELDSLIISKEEIQYIDLKKELQNLSKDKDNLTKNILDESEKLEEIRNNIKIKSEEYSTLKDECEKELKKLENIPKKKIKINTAFRSAEHALKEYTNCDIPSYYLNLPDYDKELINDLYPSISIKLHSMDIKDLRKSLKINQELIEETLGKYESRYTTKANIAIYKLMVIALRAELQNVLYNLKYDSLEESLDAIKNITKKYMTIASDGNQSIAPTIVKFIGEIEYLFLDCVKIEYQYYVKKEQQKAEQAAIREQMKQEAAERKILETQRKQVEAEEEKYKNEIGKIQEQLKVSQDSEKISQLENRILELQKQLELVETKKDDIISRQNGKAGNVYIISNLGSFGDNIFKIGMTRRLDPFERIKELSSASVPFTFDIHSFIFSDDAVGLEQKLHSMLDDKRVNKINLRKEFFNISIDELEELVNEIDPSAEFNKTMLAEEYHQSLSLCEQAI